jgi:hypothetical protein
MSSAAARMVSSVRKVKNKETSVKENEEASMKAGVLLVFALVGSVLILSVPAFAHHGNAALDNTKKVTLKGTVTEWLWANPHCWLKFDVKDDKGAVVNWVVETNNAADMIEKGWTKQIFKVGDEVTVTFNPSKNDRPVGRAVSVVLPNGQTLGMAYLKQ